MSERRRLMVVMVAGLLTVLAYVGMAALSSSPGFPLDDAWIHQTYARNLAQNGRWEFTPGVISAGSTAPLWTMLLTVGYWLRLPHFLWAYLLGVISLWLLAVAGMRLWRQLWPRWRRYEWIVGLTLVATWPLVWAAASGMETLLFAGLGLLIAGEWAQRAGASVPSADVGFKFPARLGLLTGLLVLTRPDGVVLALLVAVGLLLAGGKWQHRLGSVGVYVGTAVLPLVPYFMFNLWSSGSVWPNTFYAKQTEYAALLLEPIWSRLSRLLFFSLGGPEQGWRGMSGAHLLLLPGVGVACWRALQKDWRERRLLYLLPLLWAGGHILLYAWRLPVTYQHGRYLLAALPVWVVYGLGGWGWLLQRAAGDPSRAFLVSRAAALTFILMLLVFLGLGAQQYSQDVAFIEGEMVTVAHWLADNTAPDALIAAHDIGAIGYFAKRPLLDLAGLISPQIIPLLTDPAALSDYVLTSDADYLVTAPGWPYQRAVTSERTEFVFDTDYVWTRLQGLNNMAVYRLQ